MKNMRKLLAVALAVMMVMSLATTAFAADADLSGHTYKAYQIFTGTQADDSAKLGNLDWGNGIDGDAFLAALKADASIGNIFTDCASAIDVAEAITGWTDDNDNARAFAKIAYSYITGEGVECVNGETTLDAGYYLVVDVTENVSGSAYNLALLQLTKKGDFVIANKTDVPEFEKKIKDINDSTDEDYSDWQDSADHDIGDDVPFLLKATLASNVADYATYKVVFHDTLSEGLTFNADSVIVKVDTKTLTKDEYTLSTDCTDGCSFEIIINDVKAHGATNNSIVTVEYTAELNKNAVIGYVGNPNFANLEYSNNPNWGPEYNEDGTPKNPGDSPSGKTPVDKVIVFTYKVVVNKVDENGVALAGAGFTLFKQTGVNEAGEAVWTQIGEELTGSEMTQFMWEGLDDGNFKLVETTTPEGYNTIADIYFTITAEHDLVWEAQEQTAVLTKLEGGDKFTGDVETGAVTSEVENKSGVELPETGGIGTTIFYTLGAMLALGAAVLLITKKRMSNAE